MLWSLYTCRLGTVPRAQEYRAPASTTDITSIFGWRFIRFVDQCSTTGLRARETLAGQENQLNGKSTDYLCPTLGVYLQKYSKGKAWVKSTSREMRDLY